MVRLMLCAYRSSWSKDCAGTIAAMGDRMKSRTLLREMQKGLTTLENSFFKKKREKKRRKKQRKKKKEKEKTAITLSSTYALGFLS